MKKEWKLVYDLNGGRGAVYITTLSRSGAIQLFLTRFPEAKVVRVSQVREVEP